MGFIRMSALREKVRQNRQQFVFWITEQILR